MLKLECPPYKDEAWEEYRGCNCNTTFFVAKCDEDDELMLFFGLGAMRKNPPKLVGDVDVAVTNLCLLLLALGSDSDDRFNEGRELTVSLWRSCGVTMKLLWLARGGRGGHKGIVIVMEVLGAGVRYVLGIGGEDDDDWTRWGACLLR